VKIMVFAAGAFAGTIHVVLAGWRRGAGSVQYRVVPDDIAFTRGAPATVLPTLPSEIVAALDSATATDVGSRREALADVAVRWPRCLEAWAALAEMAEHDGPVVDAYAFARVGYHRGLDALRAAGWRGSGYVRWRDESNRGFLRCLAALGRVASAIGEEDEAERCRLFLRQLDPEAPTRV